MSIDVQANLRTIRDVLRYAVTRMNEAGVFFGHGQLDAVDEALSAAIELTTGRRPQLSTTGGTSDGRFLATVCRQVVEFGPPNSTIHKVNECIRVADLEPLKDIYQRTLEFLLPEPGS